MVALFLIAEGVRRSVTAIVSSDAPLVASWRSNRMSSVDQVLAGRDLRIE
ncbi:hypothetical protein JM946_12025 [Steroidobacter sp. S1-65]|uniref:Uncharacterized protein n=1 Tax=Steroidobacter gossypii TaxID=2805490 RepID=A0ABS1WWZ0_9GAMM|nr:hypothetical protein [Steroidobacter gossypii]MBM0105483.1 hypothetical protein [Steroidobacter gossypii]